MKTRKAEMRSDSDYSNSKRKAWADRQRKTPPCKSVHHPSGCDCHPPTPATHTPTPWKLQYTTAWHEGFKDRGPIFQCNLATGTHVPKDQNVVNAAFIVRACNNFEVLLLAVKGFQRYLQTDSRESKDLADIIARAEGRE